MALLIIVLGALLAGTGAFFVVLGFDIVMTDRGAAMTMAGTTLLAGGIITVALGCAILRLTQLLRVAESNQVTEFRQSAEKANIVEAVSTVASASNASNVRGQERQEPQTSTIPQPTMLPPLAAVAGATVAVGSGLAAATLATTMSEPAQLAQTSPRETDIAEAPQPDVDDLDAALMSALDATGDTDAQDGIAPPIAEDTGKEPDDDSTLQPPAAPRTAGAFDDILDILRTSDRPPPAQDVALAGSEDLLVPKGAYEAELAYETSPLRAADDEDDAESLRRSGQEEPSSAYTIDLPDEAAGPALEEQEAPSVMLERPQPSRTPLGSYNARGRVYTMFSDGSVEAVTDHGVESFTSMQELREHLART